MTNFRIPAKQILGSGSGGTADRVKVAFAYGDASPKEILFVDSGTTIFTAQIVIQVPFNGFGAMLRLGDAGQSDRLMAANQNLPTESGEYEVNPGRAYNAATMLTLTITPGEGCTQGFGFVILEI